MKTLLLFFASIFIAITEMSAQIASFVPPAYYRRDTTYVMDGYSYRCDGKTGNISLYNSENKWVNVRQIYKATGKTFDFGFGEVDKYNPIVDNSEMDKVVLNIIDNGFTKDFTKLLENDEWINIVMYLNSETGKVEDVKFWFTDFEHYSTLPISNYRDIELKLKEQVSYTPSNIGKQLNYILLSLIRKPLGALPPPDTDLVPIE